MGALRRVAPAPVARPFPKRSLAAASAACGAMARKSTSAGRVGDEQKLSAAPAACGAMARKSSSAGRVGGDQKLSALSPKYTKVVRNGVVVEMEVIPVVVCSKAPNARPIVKPPSQVVETAICGMMMREKKSVRRAGAEEQFSLPSPKRTKVTRDGVKTTSVEPALGMLRKRMAAELDALHAILRRAEHLSSGKNDRFTAAAEPRSEVPAEVSIKTPPAKRTKVCTGTSVQPAPEPASEVVQSTEAEKHSTADLIAKAKIRRQLLEMERLVLPDESINQRDLQRLCIDEYGSPSVMQRLGLFLKAGA